MKLRHKSQASRKVLRIQQLELKQCLHSFGLIGHEIECCAAEIQAIEFADIDGDENEDVVASSNAGLVWFRDETGRGDFQPMRWLDGIDGRLGRSFTIGDFDGDGLVDLVFQEFDSSGHFPKASLVWYQGIGDQAFTRRADLWVGPAIYYRELDVRPADLDGDGDLDIVAQGEYFDPFDVDPGDRHPGIFWFENQGQGSFSTLKPIVDDFPVIGMEVADLDGDGDLDIVRTSDWLRPVSAWYENLGDGTFGPGRTLIGDEGPSSWIESILAADMDSDGDLDLISWWDKKISWLENMNGTGDFAPLTELISVPGWSGTLHAADLNGDDNLDLVLAAGDVSWVPGLGNGSLGGPQTLTEDTNGSVMVRTRDTDSDGDTDILFGHNRHDARLALLENLDGRGNFSGEQWLTSVTTGSSVLVPADLDGDGDDDLLSASDGLGRLMAWYENEDGRGRFGAAREIARDGRRFTSARVGDIDNDRDLDIVTSSSRDSRDGRISLYRNLDGRGNFGEAETISDTAIGAQDVFLADLDGDDDLDAITAPSCQCLVAWYENIDGNGRFGAPNIMSRSITSSTSLAAGDVDGDGDTDVILAEESRNRILWFENLDSAGTFSAPRQVATDSVAIEYIVTADFDQDGDVDIAASSRDVRRGTGETSVRWFENDGRGTFRDHAIADGVGLAFGDLAASDIDGDGDTDLLVAARGINQILWFENGNHEWRFDTRNAIVPDIRRPLQIAVSDVDGDGAMDLITSSGLIFAGEFARIQWFQQRLVGDVNNDGRFDASDLVLLLQSGHFEDGEPNNSTFLQGDWNDDGDFNRLDLVFALQLGIYMP